MPTRSGSVTEWLSHISITGSGLRSYWHDYAVFTQVVVFRDSTFTLLNLILAKSSESTFAELKGEIIHIIETYQINLVKRYI